MQRYAVCQGEIGKKRHAAVIVRAVFNVSREVGGLSHADVNGHLALLCVGRGDHQSPALDREPDPAEGRGRIRREVSQSGDGDQAIRATAIWHEQVTVRIKRYQHHIVEMTSIVVGRESIAGGWGPRGSRGDPPEH